MIWALVSKDGTVEIRCTPGHPAKHGHADECEGKGVFELERDLLAGEAVDAAGCIVPDFAILLADLREERDRRLEASDKLMLPDRGFSPEMQQAILTYREALRNITEGDPQWPLDPTTKDKEK